MYYNYRTIDGYNAPINVIISKRGLGKTFGRVIRCIKRFKNKKQRFIYTVETEEMIDVLAQNKGEKFFAKIIEYLQNNPSVNNDSLLDFIMTKTEVEETENIGLTQKSKIKGGTIIINGETAGYIVSINGFAKLKRNNFVDIKEIIIDEFIPENVDIRSLQNTYKVVSLIQSIARTDENVKVYLLGNSIRLNDNILIKLKLTNLKAGEFRQVKDKYGLLVICHFVDNKQYEEFTEVANKSVAGRLASLTGEDNLEQNEFKNEIPPNLLMPEKPKSSHMIFCLHGEGGSIRINAVKDYSEYYVLEDYGRNKNNRYCLDKKFIAPAVQYLPEYKEYLLTLYNQNKLKFENSYIYIIFKSILHLEQK